MKKYITLAALLAAGTTFANAEATSPTTYDVVFGDTGTDTLTSERSHIVFNGDNSSLESWLLEFTVTKLGNLSNKSFFATNFGTAGETNERFGLSVYAWHGGDKLSLGLDGAHVKDAGAAAPGAIELDFSSVSDANPVTFRIAYDAQDNIAYLYCVTTDTFTTMNTSSDHTLYGTASGKANDVSGKAAFWTDGGASNFRLGDVADLSPIAGKSELVAQYVKTLTVPEPSAFGMLAGLGALALVASRRRRK